MINRVFGDNGSKKKKTPPKQSIPLAHVFSVIPATGFYAKFNDKGEDKFIPLIAWAFAINNAVIPLIYNNTNSTCVNPLRLRGFISIEHDVDDEEEDDNDENSSIFGS